MKKTIFFALMIGGFVASFFVGNSMSQERRQIQTNVDTPLRESKAAADVSFAETPSIAEAAAIAVQEQPSPLRAEFLELLQRFAKTYKEEELKDTIAGMREELAEGEAEQKLQQAQKLLQEIMKVYPESRAAKKAGRMLKANAPPTDEPGPPFSDPPRYQFQSSP